MKLKNIILNSFLAVAMSVSAAHADDKLEVSQHTEQNVVQDTVTLYGHELAPGSVKIDDLESAYEWSELAPLVDEIFIDADDKVVSVEEMCTQVFMRHDQYRDAVEPRRGALINKFADIYRDEYNGDPNEFSQKIVSDIESPSAEGMKQLIEDYPKAEPAILKIREVAQKWAALERLHDAAIDACPDFAKKIRRTPILTYDPTNMMSEPSVENSSPKP